MGCAQSDQLGPRLALTYLLLSSKKRTSRYLSREIQIIIESWRKHHNSRQPHSASVHRHRKPEARWIKAHHALTFNLGHSSGAVQMMLVTLFVMRSFLPTFFPKIRRSPHRFRRHREQHPLPKDVMVPESLHQ